MNETEVRGKPEFQIFLPMKDAPPPKKRRDWLLWAVRLGWKFKIWRKAIHRLIRYFGTHNAWNEEGHLCWMLEIRGRIYLVDLCTYEDV
jgi:hypothetical protein